MLVLFCNQVANLCESIISQGCQPLGKIQLPININTISWALKTTFLQLPVILPV